MRCIRRPSNHLRSFHSTRRLAKPVIGIRAEDPKRIWERRAPLSPEAVRELSKDGVRVLLQPSEKRVWPDKLYEEAGASFSHDLKEAEVVLGIKEIPKHELVGGKTYAFFSHTHKGQAYNMPLLSAMVESGSRFIDWELLTDDNGIRSTAFGYLAGFAGMSDGLSGFATKALALGSAHPFLHLPRPYMVSSVDDLKRHLRKVGENISRFGTPKSLGPLTIAITGHGRVGSGAKAVLVELPTKWVTPQQMRAVVESSDPDLRYIYACHVDPADYLRGLDGSPYRRDVFRQNPQLYESTFHHEIAPWTTILLNGAFWQPGQPRLITTSQLSELKQRAPSSRMLFVVDVSCDFGGGLEFVTHATTIDEPYVQYDAAASAPTESVSDPSAVQISSIEILPAQLPRDASAHFWTAISPYIRALLDDPSSSGSTSHSRGLRRATLVESGQIAQEHSHLVQTLSKVRAPATRRPQRALVLGSGLVAGPAIRVLASRPDLDIVIASNEMEAASILAKPYENVSSTILDLHDNDAFNRLVQEADVVVSLLPAPFHVQIAERCIALGKSLVTASYVSSEMSDLHKSAQDAGVVLLNELGLDPGLDHMSAVKMIAEAKAAGDEITSFVSFCGGLPSPEISNGPLGYKFSWSPRGVLTAATNSARFRLKGRQIDITGTDLLAKRFADVPMLPGFRFEGLANRDSLKYLEQYGLSENLPTILRGTLRYPGFAEIVNVFKRLGLLDTDNARILSSWNDLIPGGHGPLKNAILQASEGREDLAELVNSTLSRLGLLSKDASGLPTVPQEPMLPLDLLSRLLGDRLRYGPTERDAVVLHHELGVKSWAGAVEMITSTLVKYGEPGGESAMASTVGIPIALGALLCLDGKISQRGIVSPSHAEVWKPLLADIEAYGIDFSEERRSGRGMLPVLEKSFVV